MIFAFILLSLVHPIHETDAEIQWNAKTSRVEVTIRFDALDEQWIRQRISKQIQSQEEGNAGRDDLNRERLEYLRKRFRVTERPKKGEADSVRYHWVGRQRKGADVWWYFEIEPIGRKGHDEPGQGQRPSFVDVRLLRDRDDGYTHRLLFRDDTPKRSVSLTSDQPRTVFRNNEHD